MTRLASLLLIASLACAQPAALQNARVQTRSASGGLDAAIRSVLAAGGPQWIGYAVPSVKGEHQMCCWSDSNRACALEGGRASSGVHSNGPVQLEPPQQVEVLARVENGAVQKVRIFSPDCLLDAGGLPVVWLTGVRPADSIQWLESLIGAANDQFSHGAVAAIAFHADPAADSTLESLVTPGHPDRIRRDALFWMGNLRGARGYEAVRRFLQSNADDKLREHAIFALTLNKEPGAIPTIIDTAKHDRSSRVRGQALFWLSQKAGKQALGPITDAIENDPDTNIKKKAVFALSQLPKDESIPKLIDLARHHPNPAVRKQAMFWLGQSHDPRALQFFEEILK